MIISDAGRAIIMENEGCSLVAYPDPGSPRARCLRETKIDDKRLSGAPWTIGYGHTGLSVVEGTTITAHQAETLLEWDIQQAETTVERAVTRPLNGCQFSALVSFVFNVGSGKKGYRDGFVELRNGQPSTLLRLVNEGSFAAAAEEFVRFDASGNAIYGWIHSGGVDLPGLIKRRAAEKTLFLTLPS